MWINSLDDCYRILQVNPEMSFEEIEKKYHKEAIKYHKFRKIHPSYRDHFIAMVLAFDCLDFMHKLVLQGKLYNSEDSFIEWQENKYAIAYDIATKYLQLKQTELENQFYKGFVIFRRIIFIWFALIGLIVVIIGFTGLISNHYPVYAIAIVLIVLVPVGKKIYEVMSDERKSNQRLRYIDKIHEGFRYKGGNNSNFNEEDILTDKDKKQLPE